MSNWFENERFWEKTFPLMFREERFEGTAAEMTNLLELIGEVPRDVLELCCGPGRASVELARHGCRVTGVDRTRFMLERRRAHGRSTRRSRSNGSRVTCGSSCGRRATTWS